MDLNLIIKKNIQEDYLSKGNVMTLFKKQLNIVDFLMNLKKEAKMKQNKLFKIK